MLSSVLWLLPTQRTISIMMPPHFEQWIGFFGLVGALTKIFSHVEVGPGVPLSLFSWHLTVATMIATPLIIAVYSFITTCVLQRFCGQLKIQRQAVYTWKQWTLEALWMIPTIWVAMGLFYYLYLWNDTMPTIELAEDASYYDIVLAITRTVVFFIFFDAFEYFVHYMFHNVPVLYRNIHKVHHQFTSPSLMSGLSFHPVEALLFFAPIIVLFWYPVHDTTFGILFALFNSIDLLAHAGYEIPVYEKFSWIIGTTKHHDYHHEHFKPNYSVYLSVWDTIMKTYQKTWNDKWCPLARQQPFEDKRTFPKKSNYVLWCFSSEGRQRESTTSTKNNKIDNVWFFLSKLRRSRSSKRHL